MVTLLSKSATCSSVSIPNPLTLTALIPLRNRCCALMNTFCHLFKSPLSRPFKVVLNLSIALPVALESSFFFKPLAMRSKYAAFSFAPEDASVQKLLSSWNLFCASEYVLYSSGVSDDSPSLLRAILRNIAAYLSASFCSFLLAVVCLLPSYSAISLLSCRILVR